jgi:hypothetical protein
MDNLQNNNVRDAMYGKMTREFIADVRYRLKNAYELIKGEDDFLAKLYLNAKSDIIAEDATDEIICDRRKRQKFDDA